MKPVNTVWEGSFVENNREQKLVGKRKFGNKESGNSVERKIGELMVILVLFCG